MRKPLTGLYECDPEDIDASVLFAWEVHALMHHTSWRELPEETKEHYRARAKKARETSDVPWE